MRALGPLSRRLDALGPKPSRMLDPIATLSGDELEFVIDFLISKLVAEAHGIPTRQFLEEEGTEGVRLVAKIVAKLHPDDIMLAHEAKTLPASLWAEALDEMLQQPSAP